MKADQFSQRLQWEDISEGWCRRLVLRARAEDLLGEGLCRRPQYAGDVTSRALAGRKRGEARLISRAPMVVCGMRLIPIILQAYHRQLHGQALVIDGSEVSQGTILARIEGPVANLLQAERVLLNFLQHLSGVATRTASFVQALGTSSTRILDTRKTTPGFRYLEKYAVACGGGWNHRMGLFDRVLIKDNHLAAIGSQYGQRLEDAVRKTRHSYPDLVIEAEVDSLAQIPPVLHAGADVILLDNFSDEDLQQAISIIGDQAATEASGGIDLPRIPRLAGMGLDFISTGALVHQSTWVDIALDWG